MNAQDKQAVSDIITRRQVVGGKAVGGATVRRCDGPATEGPTTDALQQSVEELFFTSVKAQPMRGIAIEGSDGIMMGGIIIVRGEREFGLLCSFLQKPAVNPVDDGASVGGSTVDGGKAS